MKYRRNPQTTEEEIERIFAQYDNEEMKERLKEVQQKHESVKLATKLEEAMGLNKKEEKGLGSQMSRGGISDILHHPVQTPINESGRNEFSMVGQKRPAE